MIARENSKQVLAIDLGTSGPKVAVLNQEGRILAAGSVPVETHFLPGGGAEQDPLSWWDAVKRGATQVLRSPGVDSSSIIAVSVTSQYASTVAVDESGSPLMNVVMWLDQRGAPYNRAVTSGFPRVSGYGLLPLLKWIRITGLVPTQSGVDSLAHMLFIKNERPDVYRRTAKFLEPMDYLNLRFTGRFAANQCTAMPTMLSDNRKWDCREYSPELLKLSGIDKNKLPELLPVSSRVGPILPEVARELGLGDAVQVISSANDATTGAIGAGAIGIGDPMLGIGSSSVINCHVRGKKTDVTHLLASMPSPVQDSFILQAENGMGGRCLEFFLNNIVFPKDALSAAEPPENMLSLASELAAEVPPGSEGVIFMPWLNGSLAPKENPLMAGGFINLTLKHSRGHLVRAVFEGVAMNLKWMLSPIEKFVGKRFDSLRFSGGGAMSETWAQILADVLELPIHQVADPRQVNVRGAAFLAFDRLGLLPLTRASALVPINKTFLPNSQNRQVYSALYRAFLDSFRRNRSIFERLNRR